MTERLLTVKDAMQIIPLGKTKVTEIFKSITHMPGGKLMVYECDLQAWIAQNMVPGKAPTEPPAPAPKRKRVKIDGLTEDGLIPYRSKKKGA